jgi:hypothetical protein
LAPLIRPILPARAGSTRARYLFDGNPKDGKAEEMAADPVDGKPKDGGSCTLRSFVLDRYWPGFWKFSRCLSCLRITNVDG